MKGNSYMKKATSYLLFVTLMFLLSSCLPEKKLAQDFLNERPSFSLLIFPSDFIYKFNHKGEEIDGFDTLTESQQDSALFASSLFMRRIDDSIFLERYTNNFIDECRKLGFKVYLSPELDSSLQQQPQSYLLNIAQLQLDEYTYMYEDRQPMEDSVFFKKLPLDAVDYSIWFELSKLNTSNPVKTVLYASHTATDDINGTFYLDPWSLEVQYRYYIDTLTLQNLYDMASILGTKHADYLFDFFMNQYISFHLPPDFQTPYWFHYNRQRNTLSITEEEMFEILQGSRQ